MNLPDLFAFPEVQQRIREALVEDLGPNRRDVTTFPLVAKEEQATAHLVARSGCILAGGSVARAVFKEVNPHLEVSLWAEEGSALHAGDRALSITGSARSLLVAERTALNFIQRMSGIATLTHQYVQAAANPAVAILDTRKTTPTLRRFEKYAVACGGGKNHRFGLYDRVMIKDNHLAYWTASGGDLPSAVRAVRQADPTLLVEVEVDTLEQLEEVLSEKPDWVLLDNMAPLRLRECVKCCKGLCKTEASGGVTLETVREIAKTGVDAISVGALTHSAPAIDLALDFV